MDYPYYTGDPGRQLQNPAQIEESGLFRRVDPKAYLPDPGLVDAVNVALVLGQPLLLTGEPGTGKTQLAYNLAAELGFGEPFKFETKSSSVARDLFYGYDTLRRFHAAHAGGSQRAIDYLAYNALGKAILLSLPAERCEGLLTPELRHPGAARRSVVVIDEIDKAPRDFPNDLLNEIEHLYFRIPELDNAEVRASNDMRPVVIVTSNSEKHLPDAFLRRCVFYNIEFPKPERLMQIVLLRLATEGAGAGGPAFGKDFLADAIALFVRLREGDAALRKKPGTAELLGWVCAMARAGAKTHRHLKDQKPVILACLGALIKNGEDQDAARALVGRWPDK
jgi:MoxR-like ATPase